MGPVANVPPTRTEYERFNRGVPLLDATAGELPEVAAELLLLLARVCVIPSSLADDDRDAIVGASGVDNPATGVCDEANKSTDDTAAGPCAS